LLVGIITCKTAVVIKSSD